MLPYAAKIQPHPGTPRRFYVKEFMTKRSKHTHKFYQSVPQASGSPFGQKTMEELLAMEQDDLAAYCLALEERLAYLRLQEDIANDPSETTS